jgi:preprotein translocase subunit SecE
VIRHRSLKKGNVMAKALVTANSETPTKPQGKPAGSPVAPLQGQVAGTIERARGFLQDVRSEMRKVVTPSRKEVQATTIVVLVTVFAFAGYFYVVDSVLGYGIQAVLRWMGASQ